MPDWMFYLYDDYFCGEKFEEVLKPKAPYFRGPLLDWWKFLNRYKNWN